jgi:hypothetical protein
MLNLLSGKRSGSLRVLAVVSMLLGMIAPIITAGPTYASIVNSAVFTGGSGTASVGGTLYAKQGGALTLTVSTDNTTRCVDVTGAHVGTLTSTSGQTNWTFSFTAGSGNGVQSVTATAFRNVNPHGRCVADASEVATQQTASYVLDNSGPVVTGTAAPVPNGAGWNNSNITITWTATDVGSGIGTGGGPIPSTDSVTADTGGVTKTATATDRVGNTGTGSVTVKLDRTLPTIQPIRAPAPNIFGWNNTDVTVSFICNDALSGIKSCVGGATFTTEGFHPPVTGTATDNADNTANINFGGVRIDKTAPTLSGVPSTGPNTAGWYRNDVTINWFPQDNLSGPDPSTIPTPTAINGEGTGLTASASVRDRAGNQGGGTSRPVNIDRTAPNTTASAPPAWNNSDVTVNFTGFDALSGVRQTYYTLNGGAQQAGTSVHVTAEGEYTLRFWSEDNAGNIETAKVIQFGIDETTPTISHTQNPAANGNGWNNTVVTVTFICADTLSGIASCTGPQTVNTDGANQVVTGTAVDNAGNSVSDPASVSIDQVAPTIQGAPDRAANSFGWYNDDVVVTYTCGDALSGVDSCTSPQTLGEGANQSATGTAADAAGNTASDTVGPINVDKTAPTLNGGPGTAANSFGWYSDDVTVVWTASDSLSGLASAVPAPSLVTGEGNDLSASASISDRAGNTTNTTVSGIKIDRTAPSTLASVPAPLASGWYASGVQVTLTGVDAMSGVDKTYYRVDSGAAQEYNGAFTHSLGGIHTITFWSQDKAGNVEDASAPGHTITLKIDNLPPTIVGSRSPAANSFGWNNSPVMIDFDCDDAESGVASCVGATLLTNEGANQSVTGTALDSAGNTAGTTVSPINIDLTAPLLSGAPTAPANAAGWYKNDVTISWSAVDGLSGVDTATLPANSVITGEGSNLGAGPVSVYDKAGNAGTGSVSGIKIDRGAPAISGQAVNEDGTPRSPNAAGWYNSAVRVRFTATDPNLADGTLGSGVADQPDDVVLNANGANQSASGTVNDRADNSASRTVTGINIDSLAPQSEAGISCTSRNGWCRGQTATVVLTATDQLGLSGVKEIRYKVNGGGLQTANGASATVNVPLAARSGLATVEFYAVDNAGNSEGMNGVSLRFDNIAPTVSHALNPAANAAGWNNAVVTVHFTAEDDTDGSGVDPTTITPDVLVANETAGQTVNGEAYDLAGNRGTDSVVVKLDETQPNISAQVINENGTPRTPNAAGWYNSAVRVRFTCSDALSQIATCPADEVVTTNGANQSASGTAVDRAGNTRSYTLSGINIDAAAPVITINGVQAGGIYTLGAVPTPSCTATDSGGSGLVGGCTGTLTGGTTNGVGTFTYTATASDAAGNTATLVITFRVVYKWDGFLQPINDTAHQQGSASIFRAGSTVPAKFQLKRADGTVVQAASAPQWLAPARGSATTSPPDESVYSDPATSGSYYRWDATSQQYIFNWGTARNQANYYWRIGVMFDDGQVYYVNIGLR